MLTEQVCYMKGVATPYVDRAGMLHEGSGHSIC